MEPRKHFSTARCPIRWALRRPVAPAVGLFVAFLLAGASASASSTLSANGMRAEALPAPALRCAGQHAANFGFPDRKYAEISSFFGRNIIPLSTSEY